MTALRPRGLGGDVRVPRPTRPFLDRLYRMYNRRALVSPDPLEVLYRYDEPADRELAGLVAALLAYGGVRQIVASAADALFRLGPHPAALVRGASPQGLRAALRGFRHRWTTGDDVAALLLGVKRVVEAHGSLERCFLAGLGPGDETVLPALAAWVEQLRLARMPGRCDVRTHDRDSRCNTARDLLACPRRGSACKRLNLFLRWMVRKDEVDPGLWTSVPRSKLVVPLDVHMFRIGRAFGMTRRRQADLKAALEITGGFRGICPGDPVRYDFALTRAAMRGEIRW